MRLRPAVLLLVILAFGAIGLILLAAKTITRETRGKVFRTAGETPAKRA